MRLKNLRGDYPTHKFVLLEQRILGCRDVSTTMNVNVYAIREAKRESEKLLDTVVGMN